MKTSRDYKPINLPPLSKEQLKEIDTLKKMSDKSINLKDIPEATDNQLKAGNFYYFNSLKLKKTGVHILLDNDNLDWLKSYGKGYQPRLNNVLRWAKLNNCPIDQL